MFLNEIIKDVRSLKSDPGSLKKFGLTLGIFFALLALYQLWRHHAWWVHCLGLSAFFLFFAFVWPRALGPVQEAWMSMAFVMGYGMTRVMLFILFFFVVTPIGLLARACGNRFLDRKWKEGKESYWILRPQGKIEKTQYERQF